MHNVDLWTVVKTAMPVWSPLASGLVAAFIVHLLTQSRDRERWILDSKKSEFKELLTALSDSYVTHLLLVHTQADGLIAVEPTQEDLRRFKDSVMNLTRVARDRIFIVEDMDLGELLLLWGKVTGRFFKHRDVDKFCDEYKIVSGLIVDIATKSVPKSAIQRLAFWRK